MSHEEVEFRRLKWFIREAISGELLATVTVAEFHGLQTNLKFSNFNRVTAAKELQ